MPDDQTAALLKTIADLRRELAKSRAERDEALAQQSASAEILATISPSHVQLNSMFQTIVDRTTRLCDATFACAGLFEGEALRFPAISGVSADSEFFRSTRLHPPNGCPYVVPLARAKKTAQTPDLRTESGYLERDPFYTTTVDIGGARTALRVPLLDGSTVLGHLWAFRQEVRPFSDRQVALVQNFADQAAIAIQNLRLFNETREALEQQTATADILRVISQSPTDAQPVFDTIAAAAMKLCGGNLATVVRFDGTLVHIVALASGWSPREADAIRQRYPRPPSPETVASRAILMCNVVNIGDVQQDAQYAIRDVARSAGYTSALGVPLLLHGKPIGAIGVGRAEVGLFPEKQIALLKTFADQAVIAIENVRLFTELQARTTELMQSVSELKALGDVGQAVSSTLDLETVLATVVARATQLAGMHGGSIWEYDEAREAFHLHATEGLPADLVQVMRATPIPKGEGALGRMAITGEPVVIHDIVDERNYQSRARDALIRCGFRSILTVPLLREGHLLGALAVNRKTAGDFAPRVVDLLKTFATQSALAIQNARLYREIELKSRELQVASQHKSEFLANMSHELRTPLNAIIGFSEVLLERMFGEVNAKQAEYLGDILQSGQHLLSLINDILDLSKIEAGRMELNVSMFDLPATIENTLTLVRERAIRRGITLAHTFEKHVGTIHADERKVKQVLLNLLSNAIKFTPEGGRIDVRAALKGGMAEVSVSDTGVGIAPEEQEAVFEEFRQVGTASKKVEGTGLGLAISRKYIELHGGRIWVTSQVGNGSTFAFTLPL